MLFIPSPTANRCHLTYTVVALLAALVLPLGSGATVTYDGGPSGTGTALDTTENWVGDALPTTDSEVLLDNSTIILPLQFTNNTTAQIWGSLIWNNNATSTITLDTATATNRLITLSGGGGSSEAIAKGGAVGDLILMGSDATSNTLTIGGNAGIGTGRLNLTLGASGNFNVVNSGATLNIISAINGVFNLTKTGAGTLTLAGANTFGSTAHFFTLNAGTVNVNSSTALGHSGNTFVINGGTFDNTSGAAITTSNYKQTWNGNFTFKGTNNLTLGTGVVSLGTAAGTSRTVTIEDGVLFVGGVISNGTTATALIKEGDGALMLGGANTFTGGVTIKSGSVIGRASAAFGATAGTITLGDTTGSKNASLYGNGPSSISMANPITVAAGSSGNVFTIGALTGTVSNTTFSGAMSLGHDLVLANESINYLTLSGAITEVGGARSITVNAGSGTVALTGNNQFSGGVTLNSGRLQVGALNSTGSGPLVILGGSIDASSAAAVMNNSSYAWNADFKMNGTQSVTLATGNVTMNGDRVLTVTNFGSVSSTSLTVSTPIGDGGAGYGLTKKGTGGLNLNAANTYSGATKLENGVLNLVGAASSLAKTSSVTVAGGTFTIGVASGTGVANRINPAAPLTLGGNGIFSISAGATGPVNSQAFSRLSIDAGSSQLSTTSATNAGTFSFTGSGSSVYSRALGGTVRIVVGTNTGFVNAPTGGAVMGTGDQAILIGAVTGSTAAASIDFVQASAGTVSAPTYSTNAWGSGVNTNMAGPLSVSGDTQSLRFNTSGDYGITLNGTSTIESGGILVTSNALAGGTITGGSLQARAGQDLWAYVSTTAANPQGLTIESLIADNGGSSLTKSGAGRMFLTNANNSYTGGTYLGEGILNITAAGALGTGALHFTGNGTLQAGAEIDLANRAIDVAAGYSGIIDTNGFDVHFSGGVSGQGGLTKTGTGTLILSGANTYAGTTIVNGGTLLLDFAAPGAPVSNIISPESLIALGAGTNLTLHASAQTLAIRGKDGTANSQVFGGSYANVLGNTEARGLYLNRGMTRLDLSAGAGGTLEVNLGAITRGHTTDVNNAMDIKIGAGVRVLTSNANGLLGSFATVNGASWASVSGGEVIALPTASYSTNYGAASVSLDVGTGGTLTANPGSLRFNNASAATVNPGSGVVRSVSQGGILVTAEVGANTSSIGPGALAGFSSRDLMIHQNNVLGDLRIEASIVDTGARTMGTSKNGLGTLVLTATNSATGNTYVNEGTLVALGDAVAATTKTATSTANSATLMMTDTSGIFIGQAVTQATALTTASTTWTVVAINPGVSVTLSANANATVAGGTFNFGGGGALGGGANGQYVAPGATLQLGDGGTTGSLFTGQTVTNNGVLRLNRSNDFTFGNVVSGAGSFEKRGSGNVTLTGTHTFTGDTRIMGGSLILSGIATNLSSSTLDYSGYGGTLSFGALTAATLGGLKGNQDLALTNANGLAVTLGLGANHQDNTYSGSLSGLGGISKSGGGTFTLQGTHSYAGSTGVTAGTLNLEGTFTEVGSLAISAGILNLSGTYGRQTYVSTIGLTVGGGVFNLTGTLGTSATVPTGQTAFSNNSVTNIYGTAYLSGASSTFRVGENTSATVNITGGDLTLGMSSAGLVLGRSSATASGYLNLYEGSVTVPGTSTVVRIGAGYTNAENSGPSVMTIAGGLFTTNTSTGTIQLGSSLAGNTTSSGTLNLDGGTLATNRSVVGGTAGQSFFNFNGGMFMANGTGATLSTNLTAVNVRNGGAKFDTNGFDIAVAAALQHSAIEGDHAIDGGLTKSGAGILTLSGANTYTGPTIILEGALKVGSAGTAVSGPLGSLSAVMLADAAGVTLDLGSYNMTVGSLAGGGGNGGTVIFDGDLVLGGNNQTAIFGGLLTGSGAISKAGTGTWELTGDNVYSGGTTVTEGRLLIGNTMGTGSATGTGTLFIQSGGTLAGSGRIAPAEDKSITISGGVLSIGDHSTTAGYLELATSGTGSVSLESTTVIFDLVSGAGGGGQTANLSAADRLVVSGEFVLGSGNKLTVENPNLMTTFAEGDEWKIFDWSGLTGGVTGTFSTFQMPQLSSNLEWNFDRLYTQGVVQVVAIIPEPSRALLLLVGALAIGARRRRRQKCL